MKSNDCNATSRSMKVYQALLAEIRRDFHAGDRLPPMRALQKRFGVSINTISAALGMLANKDVVEKRHGSGVYVKGITRPFRIGILSGLDLLDSRIGPVFRLMAAETRNRLEALGGEARVYVGSAEPGATKVAVESTCPQFWQDIDRRYLDGVIILNAPSTPEWHQRIRSVAIPKVGTHSQCHAQLDIEAIVREAVHHLVSVGCRRLALIGGSCEPIFQDAVFSRGAATCEEWTQSDVRGNRCGDGFAAMRRIWMAKEEKPDGLVILEDMLFAEAQQILMQHHVQVPAELKLALLGTQGALPSSLFPYTAFVLDIAGEAAFLVDQLWKQLKGEEISNQIHRSAFHIKPVSQLAVAS